MTLLALLLLLLVGAITVGLIFLYSGTDNLDDTTPSFLVVYNGSSDATPTSDITTTTAAVSPVTPRIASTAPSRTPGATPSTMRSTTPGGQSTTKKKQSTTLGKTPSTMPSTTPTKTPSRGSTTLNTKPSTTRTAPKATASTASTIATTWNSSSSQGRPMNPKTILCTFGNATLDDTVGPQDGICDIIMFDFLYGNGRGTFLNQSAAPLQWFLEYVKTISGRTEFGMAIHNRRARRATKDLADPVAQEAIRNFWSRKIRHYGVLNFPVHDRLVTSKNAEKEYIALFEKMQELQEANRYGSFFEPGYLILGISLYAPQTGDVHVLLKEILETAPIDGVIIRTHLEDSRQRRGGCKITGPNVYTNRSNKYEVSMVEALDYVQSNYDLFRRYSLMVSFSMSVLFTRPRDITSKDGYQLGRDCEKINFLNTYAVVEDQHVRHGIDTKDFKTSTYDSPDTIKWKICMSTKRYPTLQFGVALFSLEDEDGRRSCEKHGWGILNYMAGYWRTQEVSSYIKNVIRQPEFLTKDPTC